MKFNYKTLLITGLVASASSSNAALLAFYADGPETDAAALLDKALSTDVTVSALNNVGFEGGGSITRNSFGPATPNGEDWLFARGSATGGTLNTTTDYFGFTVGANGTDTLSLTSFTFDLINSSNNATRFTSEYELFVNVDGAGFNSFGSDTLASNAATDVYNDIGGVSIDLSSITGATSVELRLAIADDSGSPGTVTFVQDIQLNGDAVAAPIPEPSSTALIGLGGLALILRRRK